MPLPARSGRSIDPYAPPTLRRSHPDLAPVMVPHFPSGHPPDATGLYLSLDEAAGHLEERLYRAGGILQARTIFTTDGLTYEQYDTQGQLHDSPNGAAIESYFLNGGIAETRSIQHGQLQSTTMYDEHGEALEHHEYAEDGSVRSAINEPALAAYMQRGFLGEAMGPDMVPLPRLARGTPGWLTADLLEIRNTQFPADAFDHERVTPAFARAAEALLAETTLPAAPAPSVPPQAPPVSRHPARPAV